MIYFDQKAMRAAIQQMVRRVDPNIFLTFSFGHPRKTPRNPVGRHPGWHPVPPEAIHARVKDFFDAFTAQAFVPPAIGDAAFGFLESPTLNPHLHVVACADEDQLDWLDRQGKAVWRRFSNNGQLDIEVSRDPANVLSYSMKRFTNQKAFENLFIY